MIEDILGWWFGDWDDAVPQAEDDPQMRRWWHAAPEIDAHIRDTYRHLLSEDLSEWEATPRGRLAKVLVLDQFSRVVHRGTGRAFENDAEARATLRRGLVRGDDGELQPIERSFFYMPLMHSEDLGDHDLAIRLFGDLADDTAGLARAKGYVMTLDFERKHRAIVEQWGRYPHRNAPLGRESTPEELEFLKQVGSSF